jgi:hypothetical protein
MENACELLINVVRTNKPNMLTGLNQKVSGRYRGVPFPLSQTAEPPANRQLLSHPLVHRRNVVSPSLSSSKESEP